MRAWYQPSTKRLVIEGDAANYQLAPTGPAGFRLPTPAFECTNNKPGCFTLGLGPLQREFRYAIFADDAPAPPEWLLLTRPEGIVKLLMGKKKAPTLNGILAAVKKAGKTAEAVGTAWEAIQRAMGEATHK